MHSLKSVQELEKLAIIQVLVHVLLTFMLIGLGQEKKYAKTCEARDPEIKSYRIPACVGGLIWAKALIKRCFILHN